MQKTILYDQQQEFANHNLNNKFKEKTHIER